MIVNLTPHDVTVVNGDHHQTIPASGSVARVDTVSTPAGVLFNGKSPIALTRTSYGAVVGLPDYQSGTYYIVSALVRQAVPHRTDVYSPSGLVRDAAGKVIGCSGLDSN